MREQGWAVAHAAKAMGISRQCAHRWLARYGEQGLAPRTVSRVLRRAGVAYLRCLDPMTGEVIRSSRSTAVRYERERPGEPVHVDVKKLGKIPDGGRWRAHGSAASGHQRDKKVKIGYDYVHSMVDDHSRLAYSKIHDDDKAQTCAGFLTRAAVHFAEHGITLRPADCHQRDGRVHLVVAVVAVVVMAVGFLVGLTPTCGTSIVTAACGGPVRWRSSCRWGCARPGRDDLEVRPRTATSSS